MIDRDGLIRVLLSKYDEDEDEEGRNGGFVVGIEFNFKGVDLR